MGYLDIQKILQQNPALRSQIDSTPKETGGTSDTAVLNTRTTAPNAQDEWEKAEAKPQNPSNSDISGGSAATGTAAGSNVAANSDAVEAQSADTETKETRAESNSQQTTSVSTEDTNKTTSEEAASNATETSNAKNESQGATTEYTVQPGDTCDVIAKRLGLTGEEATKFAEQLKKQLKDNNQLDKRGWLKIGQKIQLPGDHKAKLAESSDYTEDINVLQERYAQTISERRARVDASSVADKPAPVTPPKKEKPNTPAPEKDTTPRAQRLTISSVRNQGKVFGNEIKKQISGLSLASNTRTMLNEKITNRNIAYILEQYPELVTDIDDEVGLDVKDVKTYVVEHLNSRLRELGLNKHCIPSDLSKLDMKQIQKYCNDTANLIRKTDADNGYVFKPTAGNEGKIHKPRKSSQMSSYAGVSKQKQPTKASSKPKATASNPAKAPNNSSANPLQTQDKKPVLYPGELQYPREMQDFILEERAKGTEYIVTKSGKEYVLTRDFTKTNAFSLQNGNFANNLSTPVKFDISNSIGSQFAPKKFSVAVPFNVSDKLAELKDTDAKMVKAKDGTYTITQTTGTPNNVKSITYKYDANGNFKYQINDSATDKSATIGKINPKTKKLEFKQFKNSAGILQQIPDKVSQKQMEMVQDGGKAQIIKGYSTFTIVQTDSVYQKQHGIAKIEHKYNPFGVMIEQVYTYDNGRVVKNYDLTTKGNDAAHTPNPIEIKLPAQYQGKDTDDGQMVYGLNTAGPKENAQRFSGAIAANKASLMRNLHLTNEEYDNLAVLAMGIAEQETHFGQEEYLDTSGGSHSQDGVMERMTWKNVYNKTLSEAERSEHSQGLTQINYKNALKENGVAEAFRKYGINSFADLDGSPEKQAIATIILLKAKKNTAEGSTWQARLKKNNAKIADPNKRLTTNDVIALLWNGAGGVVKRMDRGEVITIDSTSQGTGEYGFSLKQKGFYEKKLNGAFYAKAVRAYADKFFADPATQKSGAQHSTRTANVAGTIGADGQHNLGRLGSVMFKPSGWNTTANVTNATTLINKNTNLSAADKNLLIGYIQQGLIGFGGKGGLTEDEAMSLTHNDIELMTRQINALNSGSITANQANSNFAKEYLSSREFVVDNKSISPASRLSAGRSSTPQNVKMLGNSLDFSIPESFYAGKARHTANYSSGETNRFAVTRSNGVNPKLANGATVPDRYRVAAEYAEYTATKLFESGGKCKTGIAVDLEYSMGIDHTKIRGAGGRSLPHAKQLTEFYNAHPEVFSAIKYVDNGDGTSRELNAEDVHNLPCGYFGVFTPGAGYEHESGHAFVSDGFGGGFADEHDNGNWANFSNGKGEHGKLNVYGLSSSVVTVYSEKLGRTVNVPLNINPWYLTPGFRELQKQECAKRGIPVPEYKEEFSV